MKFRLPLLVLCCAIALQAQMDMNVDQLAQFIRSELALKQHTDKQIAVYLKKVHLSEKLPDKTIEDLEEQGAGPKTVEALKALQTETAQLKPPASDATYSPGTAPAAGAVGGTATASLQVTQVIPPPDSVRQQQIIDQMREYALGYTKNLPNFVCVEVTRQYIQPMRGRAADTKHYLGDILAKVQYNEGQEKYDVYSVHGQYRETNMMDVGTGGAISTGEFGSMMREIFEPASEAEFSWDHWGKLRGQKMAVFHYSIDVAHSKFTIAYGSHETGEQRIYTAYEGLVYADENTREISRITFHAVNIPKSFPVHNTNETLDYGLTDISGQKFTVPLMARLFMEGIDGRTENQIEFRNYRKFGVESGIVFGDVLAPMTPDQEQPAAGAAPSQAENKKTDTRNLPHPVESSDPFAVPTLPPPPPPK
ncbi:MAG TPA: hypothetical protein VH351_11965 [Bryobacteraceae bacterium]|nr:hypothetical protein [Bryobacteraceae bacterium]